MRHTQTFCAALLAALLLVSSLPAQDNDARKGDPIVAAVEQTIDGVVAIRVPRPGERDAIGSGVIVDESGLIVTNYHVTAGRRFLNVRLNDGTDLKGEVIVNDKAAKDADLAVVKVEPKEPLKALRLGSKDDLKLAEQVIAIGSPFGYDGTVSVGRISALNRAIHMPNDVLMKGLIQHNAAINPGNSGGPLININKKVIGINVAMRDGAQNIAFAINATTVIQFLKKNLNAKQMAGIEHGLKVEDAVIAAAAQRVIVKEATVALKAGDQIVAVGPMNVANTFDVERALYHSKPGQKVELKVVRQGREMAVMLTLGSSVGAGQVAAHPRGTPAARQPATTANVTSANEH